MLKTRLNRKQDADSISNKISNGKMNVTLLCIATVYHYGRKWGVCDLPNSVGLENI